MQLQLEGKIAIVTGSSRGIGKAIAIEMAKAGAKVAVAARTEVEAAARLPGTVHTTVKEIQSLGGEAIAVRTDVTREEDVMKLVTTVNERYGAVDILVNNAGITTPLPFVDLTVKKWDLLMAVNVRGIFLCCKAVVPQMIGRRKGNIINISSLAGNVIAKGNIAYGVTKAALERFTLGLAREMRKHNIAVNALRPYFTLTDGVKYFMPGADTSDWQSPRMWGKYASIIAMQDAESLTGQLLDEKALKERFGDI